MRPKRAVPNRDWSRNWLVGGENDVTKIGGGDIHLRAFFGMLPLGTTIKLPRQGRVLFLEGKPCSQPYEEVTL